MGLIESEEEFTDKYRVLTPGEDVRCRLCPLARSNELVPCCWCESWVHWRRSYTVKSGSVLHTSMS